MASSQLDLSVFEPPKKRVKRSRTPADIIFSVALVGVLVGEVKESQSPADNGKKVWASLTEEEDLMIYRINDDKAIASDQIAFHTTFSYEAICNKARALKNRSLQLRNAYVSCDLSRSELKEIRRDTRLLKVGSAVCSLNGYLLEPGQENPHLIPENYDSDRKAALKIFAKFYTQYKDVAKVNKYAVARAAGYSKLFEENFPERFFQPEVNGNFDLDIYILRACQSFWGFSKGEEEEDRGKRLYYDGEEGLIELSVEMSNQVKSAAGLSKFSWMTDSWLSQHEPVLTTQNELRKLATLSLIFSTLHKDPPKNPQDDHMKASTDPESRVFLGPVAYTLGWQRIVARYLDPTVNEVIEEPKMAVVPSFPGILGGPDLIIEACHQRRIYFDYIKKLSDTKFPSTALAITLARKLKTSVGDTKKFNKWQGAIDQCFKDGSFEVPEGVLERLKQYFPFVAPLNPFLEFTRSSDEEYEENDED